MTPPPFDPQARLRFAPSPTGYLHVGGARTALFNWLLARHCGGCFLLRIEDTDRERSTRESVDIILDGLSWLGLTWDGDAVMQSENAARHGAVIDELLAAGHAYPCFCTQERLDALREAAKAEGGYFTYDRHCADLGAETARARIEAGEPHVIRFRTEPGRTIAFTDMIGGAREAEVDRVGDFVIRRSDGSPVFHLSVVVDDHDMGITHVLRGDDHLANTPRQLLIYEALGWAAPAFGHMPMILGPDGARLSKRHGATNVLEFRSEGFLPEAMVNFLALLGWSYDDKTELMRREELIERFDVARINRSAAVFNRDKLLWMNGHYLRNQPLERTVEQARAFLLADGVAAQRMPEPWFTSLVELVRERSTTLRELHENLEYFLIDRIDAYDDKGARKHLLVEGAAERLARIETLLREADPFAKEPLEAGLRALAEDAGEKFGNWVHPLRLALSGRTATPGIFDVVLALGRETCIARVAAAREWIARQARAPKETD